MSGAPSTIARRFEDYFARQIAFLERGLTIAGRFGTALDAGEVDAILEQDEQRAREAELLAAEFDALHREWQNASGVAPGDRAKVRDLALRAETLSGELSAAYERLALRAAARADAVRAEYDALRRGHEALRKYHGAGTPDPGYIDRQA